MRYKMDIEKLQEVVNQQVLDEGLWFVAETASEAYLQQGLRKLHYHIERLSQSNRLEKPVMQKIAELTPEKFLDELDYYNGDMPYHNVGDYEASELWSEDQVKWMLNKYYELKSNPVKLEIAIVLLAEVIKCEMRHDENGHVYLKVPSRSLFDLGNQISEFLQSDSNFSTYKLK